MVARDREGERRPHGRELLTVSSMSARLPFLEESAGEGGALFSTLGAGRGGAYIFFSRELTLTSLLAIHRIGWRLLITGAAG